MAAGAGTPRNVRRAEPDHDCRRGGRSGRGRSVIRLAVPVDVENELHHLGWITPNDRRPCGADVRERSCTPSVYGAMPTSRCACRSALRHAAYMIVVLAEGSRHVALEDEGVNDPTERPEWGRECNVVDHSRPVLGLLENVLVSPMPERAALHLVDECVQPLVLDDLRRHPPANAEVPCAPGHVLAKLHAPFADASDDTLAGRGGEVHPNVQGEVKAHVRLGRDVRDEVDVRHVSPLDGRREGRRE